LWTWDPRADVVAWDERMDAIFGVDRETAPRTYAEFRRFVHPEDVSVVDGRIASSWGTVTTAEYRIVRRDGGVRWIHTRGVTLRDGNGEMVKVMGGGLDVTERRSVDERLREAQRAEVIGKLTAGFAHNFNNLLMTILPNIELARCTPERSDEHLRAAQLGAERAAEIVRQLLVLAGKQPASSREPRSIAPLVERTLEIFGGTLDRRVALSVAVDGGASRVSVDPSQLEQVLLNLLMNARDAVRGVMSPRIEVRLDVTAEADKSWVSIRVGDNGTGLDAKTRARLFEPFFTTKGPLGTGLGLATAKAIVRDHGGEIRCESAPGAGTTFTVLLPTVPDAEVRERPAARPTPAVSIGARILLIDDERTVLASTAALLREGGYEVDTAASGAEGIERFSSRPEGYSAVLVDLSMPDMPGTVVCRAIREMNKEPPVLYFSGLPLDSLGEASGFVPKPATLATLVLHIESALASARSRTD
jgi:PAS domain S-box-containing protein